MQPNTTKGQDLLSCYCMPGTHSLSLSLYLFSFMASQSNTSGNFIYVNCFPCLIRLLTRQKCYGSKMHIRLHQVDGIIYIKVIIPLSCCENRGSKDQLIWFCQSHRTEKQRCLDVSGFKTLGFWVQSLCTFKYSKLPLEIKNASISDLTAIALIWSFFFIQESQSCTYHMPVLDYVLGIQWWKTTDPELAFEELAWAVRENDLDKIITRINRLP